MAKLKNPLLSLRASGTLARVLTFLTRQGTDMVEKKPELIDVQSVPQLAWRHMFNKCVDLWHTLSAAEKAEWESAARPKHMTGYAWYISQCLRPNPGIYLPLQGGTMSGDILMATHRIKGLPNPTLGAEAARKAYVDALDRGEGHITILPWNYSAIIQGTYIFDVTASQWGYWYFRSTPGVYLDEIHYKAFMAAGTYTLRLLVITTTSEGILGVYIDNDLIATFDLYSDPAVFNVTLTDTGNVVATTGLKTIKLRIDNINPLSTGLKMYLSLIAFWRTA